MLGSSGGVVAQPLLGRSADVWGYGTSYVIGAAISALALPFLALSRRERDPADFARGAPDPEPGAVPVEVPAEQTS
jgi:hypothetical protein